MVCWTQDLNITGLVDLSIDCLFHQNSKGEKLVSKAEVRILCKITKKGIPHHLWCLLKVRIKSRFLPIYPRGGDNTRHKHKEQGIIWDHVKVHLPQESSWELLKIKMLEASHKNSDAESLVLDLYACILKEKLPKWVKYIMSPVNPHMTYKP